MKKKIYKICGVALALVLVFSLFGAFIPVNQVEADPGEVAWSGISNPGNLLRTGLNMADVEVGPIAITPDGATLFAAVQCETAIAGVASFNGGTFSFGAAADILTLTGSAAGVTGNWTSTVAVTVTVTGGATQTGSGTTSGTFAIPTIGDTVIFTGGGTVTTGTYTLTAGSVTAAITANPSGVAAFTINQWALLESTDGGYNWSTTGLTSNQGPITGIAISPYFPTDGTMYVAAGSGTLFAPAVFRSHDSGTTFTELKAVPLDSSGGNATTNIWSIDMWPASPYPYVMVGTNSDVWVLQDMPFGTWMDQEIAVGGAFADVRAVAFAPDFAATNFIWAVVGNDTGGTMLGEVTATNSPGAWGTILANTNPLLVGVADSADIGFPDDYNSSTSPYLWVGLDETANNAATSGVYRIRGLGPPGPSQAIQQLDTLDIRSIAVSGSMASATILAGQETTAAISKSESGGLTWPLTAVVKQPTGVDTTYVVMAPDFATSGLAYVATSDNSGPGTGEPGIASSAFQVSRNAGLSWNQSGLIDTTITAISDIAVVSQDTVFMVTDTFCLWKTIDALAAAPIWERILTPRTGVIPINTLAAPTTPSLDLVATSPEFDGDGVDDVVLVTNTAALPDVGVMKSADGGDVFTPMGAPGATITALYMFDDTFAFTGAAGQVYRTDDGAYSWLAATIPPAGNVVSFATSPDYANDSTLLVGNGVGATYRSTNSGATFTIVGAAIAGVTNTYVAFDPEYATNSFIYAGGNAVIARYDFTATALGWRDTAAPLGIDKTMPTGVGAGVGADEIIITGTAVADNGTITVLTGSILVTPLNAALIAGVGAGGTLTITAGMGAVAWSTTAAADTLAITATATGTSGTWLSLAGVPSAVASLVFDSNTNVTFATGPSATSVNNPFSLPDAAGVPGAPSVINGLLLSPDGTIYGSNALPAQGVERSLNPRDAPPFPWPTFERVTDQLPATATLAGLWLVVDPALDVVGSKNVLFSIDNTGSLGVALIMTYTDTLATTIVLAEPADGTVFPRETAVTMVWEELTGADTYHWQIATDSLFRLVVDEGNSRYTSDSSIVLAAGRTYYWRVRVEDAAGVGDPLFSRWSNAPAYESSAHWSFTTFLGARPWHPFVPISGVNPSPGATDVPLKPTFQWNGADWATTYDLELADNSAFTGAIKKTLSATAWTCDPALDYNTTYYWKVKAVSDVTESEWTDVGVFTTVAEVVPPAKVYSCPQCGLEFSTEAALQAHWDKFHAPPTPVKPTTPAYIWAIIGVGALLVVAVLVLILRTRRVA